MRTRLVLDHGTYVRFVVANYYGRSGRATRAEVRRFVAAAVETAARDWAAGLSGRAKATAERLRAGGPLPETLEMRDGLSQPRLF